MEKIVQALNDYKNQVFEESSVSKLIRKLERLGDLSDYVSNLPSNKREGMSPIVSIIDDTIVNSPVRLDLYWNPKTRELECDWDDANPYREPCRCR